MELSVIIVSYNTKQVLKNCLNSIYKNTLNLKFEVIVVDNNSLDGSADMVAKSFPKVKLIRSNENLGFGKANNLGSTSAKGDYLLFLNSDTLLSDNVLKSTVTKAKTIENLGALTCQLLYEDGTIQPTGGYFPTIPRLISWHTGLDEVPILKKIIKPVHPDQSFYKGSFELDWLTGAFLLIPRPTFLKVKGFDANIFMYGEDLELCYRLKKLGLKIIYSDYGKIVHLQNKSSSSHFALVSEIKGIKYFYNKHHPSWQLPLINFTFKTGSLLRWFVFGIIQGSETKKQAYKEALKA